MITICKALKIDSCQDLEGEVKRRWLRYKSIHESEEGQSRKTKWSLCSSTGAIVMEDLYNDCRRRFRLSEQEQTDRLRWYQARCRKNLRKIVEIWITVSQLSPVSGYFYQCKCVPCLESITWIKKEKQTPGMMVDDVDNELCPCKPYLCTNKTGRNHENCYD